MELTLTRIPARSRRQAMDWSLVLLSQGIEPTIEAPDQGIGWGLLVAPDQYEPALQAIQLYRLENRGWPWQQRIFRPGLLFDWGSLAWVLLLAMFYWLDAQKDLRAIGLMDSNAVRDGQWWRLFTALWLHGDLAHLTANATFGLIFLGLAMGRYGTGVGLWAAYLAGVGGNAVTCLIFRQGHRSLGASGMVMGSLGLLAIQSFSLWRESPHAPKYILSGALGGLMLFVLLALEPGTDVLAHAGGFASGLLLGTGLLLFPGVSKWSWSNLGCGLGFAVLVIISWWLALRAGF